MLKKLFALLVMFYTAIAFAAVDVNTGSAADLDGIKGIGPGMSGKIVAERKNGNFKDWNDFIARVKGVGSKNAAKLSANGLTVNGAAMPGAAAAPAAKPAKAAATPTVTVTTPAPAAATPAAPAAKPATADAAKK